MKRLISIAMIALFAVPAMAQVGVPRSGPRGGSIFHITLGGAPAHLIAERADVQSEIKLQPAQKARIAQIVKANAKAASRGDLDMWALESPVLTPVQRKRALELGVQALGPFAVYAAEYGSDLALTAAQKQKVNNIRRVYLLAEDRGLAESMMGKSHSEGDAKLERVQRMQTFVGGIKSTLTAGQRAKLKAMAGKAFRFTPPIKEYGLVVWMPAFGMH